MINCLDASTTSCKRLWFNIIAGFIDFKIVNLFNGAASKRDRAVIECWATALAGGLSARI
jgi:hypothetical protein